MKNLKLILRSLFFVLLATMAYGQEEEDIFASITESETLRGVVIQLDQLNGLRTHIHIMNYRGATAYSDYVWGEEKYAANFVMEGMPAGDYLVCIKNRRGEQVRAIHLTDGSLRMFNYVEVRRTDEGSDYLTMRREGRLIARFRAVEGKPALEVQLANLKYRPTTLYLASLEGISVMERTLEGKYGYAKQLNLNGLAEGSYYLYLRTPETSLWQIFNLKEGQVELREKFYLDRVGGVPYEVVARTE